ncbi:hypothetical protein I307_05535 [Cryptococcus deuterogattii 99/473]|uniref:Unplaced genomic scaffold supercont1.15, whole genome shotgun sequence n=1 Tax=Cryptococcus deuterogattii Ram5 TaxID=1296110 RepID=A0A0D0SZ29_9TREE|nr:hypothetical protein I309_03681 [Cryptococcus deuterogattii LA55]KIR32200.1 hypothetical protein I352_05432 [Cryptococcus deuterogattii MMRL2647]KIR38502.1 hypothetical protein I313_05614 [Cryptococcus deuterogattii Ram5]KIR70489.1 hypothetical protein I310_05739 [Cryptococcus deuterogattii CA1014]KIR90305.1 hypothetical protein I304_05881 [Cryptococcus deuterogattii CBS 10090]KIY55122.1 hypothetical protein I307_05535 [Cryptococcus deuterogattii 99/473]
MSATNADVQSSTTGSFVAALVVAGITVGGFSALWLVLHGRKDLQRVFQPRTILPPEGKRPQPLPSGIIAFWKTLFKTPDQDIIVSNGPDAYFYVRFLKVFGLQMLIPYVILTCAILIPVSAVSPNQGMEGLNILTFGNVASSDQVRHVAHFLVTIILMSWTVFLIWREYNHFVDIRQTWMTTPQHLSLARARTIAITNIPESINSSTGIKELAGLVSRVGAGNGSGTNLLALTNPFSRQSIATENTGANGDSEGGVRRVWLTRKCKDIEKVWKERDAECARLEGGVAKLQKRAAKNVRKGKTPEQQGKFDAESSGGDLIDRYVLPKKRPSWKQGLLGLIGKKQNLDTSPEYIREHTVKLDELREGTEDLPQGNTAFIRFSSQFEAHAFAKLASKTDKSNKLIRGGVEFIRTIVSWCLTIGLIIVWAIPVAFVGMVSNIDTLCANASWLAWVCELPSPALAIIKGVLPPALLAVLFMLLPVVLRLMVKMQGEIRKSDIELRLFSRFWLFQVIHGFLIVTLASGLMNALGNLGNTASQVPTLLADKLPGASIFFLTFILTATFSGAAQTYSRLVPWIMYLLRNILAGGTPRKAYMKKYKMDSFAWATAFPPTCLIMTIFVSLYIQGVCMAGLFFLSTNENGSRSKTGLGCGAVMCVMIICIALIQIYIDWFRFTKPYLIYVHRTPSVPNSSSVEPKVGGGGVTDSPSDEDALAGPELGNTSGFHERAFDHPALWKKQPVIWVAADPHGLGALEVERINDKGVEASLEYAVMNEKGQIDVQRSPPDEAWYEGFTA